MMAIIESFESRMRDEKVEFTVMPDGGRAVVAGDQTVTVYVDEDDRFVVYHRSHDGNWDDRLSFQTLNEVSDHILTCVEMVGFGH